ncbi:MAG: hypothetical protein ACPIOQ_03340, partial [Promethearchaeia archaeon]
AGTPVPRVDFRLWAASLRALMQRSDVRVCGGWGVIHSHSICNCELLEREGGGTGEEERGRTGCGARRQKSRQTALMVGQRRPTAVCLRSCAPLVRCKVRCVSSACSKRRGRWRQAADDNSA